MTGKGLLPAFLAEARKVEGLRHGANLLASRLTSRKGAIVWFE